MMLQIALALVFLASAAAAQDIDVEKKWRAIQQQEMDALKKQNEMEIAKRAVEHQARMQSGVVVKQNPSSVLKTRP